MKKNPEPTCSTAQHELLSRLETGPLSREALHTLCEQFPNCTADLLATYEQWQLLDEIEMPEPSQVMHTNFYKMLSEETAEAAAKQSGLQFNWWTWNGFPMKWALAAGIFALGMVMGGFFRPALPDSGLRTQVAVDSEEEEREYFAQLTSQSVTDRLQATQSAKQRDQLNATIIDALFHTLTQDDNVNVRLSAIETLLHFTDHPKVRESLIRAIPFQQSPLVQLTLAEVMTSLQDKRAIEEIRRLLQKEQVEVEVKMKLEDTIETLL